MNAERLLELYEQISEAPDAIARLRRFVLDLAVRGKLVEQDASEASPSVGSAPTNEQAPYELPFNWRWMKIGDQLELLNGMAFKPTDWMDEGIRIVRIQNLNKPDAPFNHCAPEMARDRSLIDDGSFLISWSGTPGTSFGAFIWDRGPAVLNQHIFRCDFKTNAYIHAFLKLAINGRLDEMIEKAHGGVGLRHITKGKLQAMLIAVPPLAEQHRIVAKVDELMALCDRLEEARKTREETRDKLTAATLARLTAPEAPAASETDGTNAPSGAAPNPSEPENTGTGPLSGTATAQPSDFPTHARFVLETLPALTKRPAQIKTLRQTILNLAVRGALVEQDLSEEPAEILHNKLVKMKEILGKNGRFRNQKINTAPISTKTTFEIPNQWKWVRLGKLVSLLGGYAFKSGSYISKEGNQIIRLGNVKNDQILHSQKPTYISDELAHKTADFEIVKDDILVTMTGTKGKRDFAFTARVKASDLTHGRLFLNQRVGAIRPVSSDVVPLVNCFLKSDILLDWIFETATGTANQANIGVSSILDLPFPLPPLAEQHRIVAKVDALMALCDRLETALTTADTTRTRLLEALLNEALEPADKALEAAE